MTYRPDIDGLRAVAVISVILFHLNSSWLPGGFLGVDIFFVISGYLIGGILFRELSTNTFSLKNFYLRRMRRILPAFFAVVIFVLVVGGQLMVQVVMTGIPHEVLLCGVFSSLGTSFLHKTRTILHQPLNCNP